MIHLQDAIPYHVRYCSFEVLNTYNRFMIILAPLPQLIEAVVNLCVSSPCGVNSAYREVNGLPSCSCLPNYFGVPPNCRPECTINSECASALACISEKCRDPCPGSCGISAVCSVINHIPICSCIEGYTGNPFTSCQPSPRKIIEYLFPELRMLLILI